MNWERHPPTKEHWTWREYFVLRSGRFCAYIRGDYSNDPPTYIGSTGTLVAAKKLCEQHREDHT